MWIWRRLDRALVRRRSGSPLRRTVEERAHPRPRTSQVASHGHSANTKSHQLAFDFPCGLASVGRTSGRPERDLRSSGSYRPRAAELIDKIVRLVNQKKCKMLACTAKARAF
jgi:hypothetical protein